MTRPETRDARSGDVNIAYQVLGEGPRDLVVVPGWLGFEDRGTHTLKGVPGEWHLFAVGKDSQA